MKENLCKFVFLNFPTTSTAQKELKHSLTSLKTFLLTHSGRFNIFKLYIQRYMRLTPSLAFVLLSNLTLGRYFIHHSPYAFQKDLIEPCERNWLSTLLYIQVYTNSNQIVQQNYSDLNYAN